MTSARVASCSMSRDSSAVNPSQVLLPPHGVGDAALHVVDFVIPLNGCQRHLVDPLLNFHLLHRYHLSADSRPIRYSPFYVLQTFVI